MTDKDDPRAEEYPILRIAKEPYAAIPYRILEDYRLDYEARVVLGWFIGREDGSSTSPHAALDRLRISRNDWSRIRLQLEACGYLVRETTKLADGRVVVYDRIRDASPTPLKKSESSDPNSPDHGSDSAMRIEDVSESSTQAKSADHRPLRGRGLIGIPRSRQYQIGKKKKDHER